MTGHEDKDASRQPAAAQPAARPAVELAAAAVWFAGVWEHLLTDPSSGGAWSCTEAEAAAGLYRALGRPDVAERVISAHARQDEVGDEHYQAGTETPGRAR